MTYGQNIAAISTAPGTGGVAVIRISGESPLAIAEKMFRPIGKTPVKDFEPYKMYPGEIDGGDFTDFGMCVFFRGPKSYTGEDTIEFHCHGGVAISRGVLKRALALGARMATNGEFTRRAFLNGKMSLSSCEGLIDMINSESVGGEAHLRACVSQCGYRLSGRRGRRGQCGGYPRESLRSAEKNG